MDGYGLVNHNGKNALSGPGIKKDDGIDIYFVVCLFVVQINVFSDNVICSKSDFI